MVRLSIFFWLLLIAIPCLYFLIQVVRCGWKGAVLFQKRITHSFGNRIQYRVDGLARSIELHVLENGQFFGLDCHAPGTRSHIVLTPQSLAELRDSIDTALQQRESASVSSTGKNLGPDDNPYSPPAIEIRKEGG